MDPSDITIEILKNIRDEVHDGLADVRTEMRTGLAEVRSEIGQVRTDLHESLADVRTEMKELHRRQTETEVRLATELASVTGAVLQVRDLLREDRTSRTHVQDLERRVAVLEKKLG